MRKLVAGFAASVDGYIEGPDGGYDWIIIDEKLDFSAEMKRFDTLFFGRRSYEAAKAMFDKPSAGITNFVFSNTLTEVDKNFILLSGDIHLKVETLKQQEGKDIAVYGGANLLASLLNLQLVDELSISFIPVLLGAGKPMVDLLHEKVWLRFNNSRRYQNGTLVVNYTVCYNQIP
ncbi:MAG TPA: dihydrofolate reductase family protein [Flavisolibacter sp.]|jgi:dihydrofolate reductase|nr:dihydrofolate reductase family protein [Flavisolibacter sp.]